MEALDQARRRHESSRVFGVDPAFDGMATDADVLLGDRQGLAGGDAQLLLDQIHAGDHLGDRMLNLDTGVHLDEIELAVFVQELEGPRTAVADLDAGAHAALADELAHLFCDARCRCLFDHFLVATLHGAVTLAQIEGVALAVCQYLNFDMARVLQVLLHVDHVVLEELACFGFGQGDGGSQLGFIAHHAHAATTTATGGLDDHRITDALGDGSVVLGIAVDRAVRARHARYARFFHRLDGGDLVTHQANGLGARADEDEAGFFDHFGEIGVLREEAVTRVDGNGTRDLGGGYDRRHIEVGFTAGRLADADGFVGQEHMFELPIGGGVNGHCLDPELFASAQDPQGNFTAVGDDYFVQHGWQLPLFDDEQRLVKFDGLTIFNQDRFDHAGLVRLDLVHHFHGFDDAQGIADIDVLTDFRERLGFRAGGAIEGANHGGAHQVTTRGGRICGRCDGGGCRCGGRGHGRLHHHLRHGGGHLTGEVAADANGLFTFGDLQFGNAGLFNQFNQLLDFADIH